MSGKDFLSQEEIDALLRQTTESSSLGSSPEPLDVNQFLTSLEQDALGEIGNITFGSAATALSTLLGKKVDITTPQVSIISSNELADAFPQPHVAIHVKFVEGFHGINLLVIKSRDALVIADLMMGGNGYPQDEELSEIHISAVQEAMNQMMGSSATSMSTIFDRFVNISPPGINILNFAENEGNNSFPQEDVFIKVSFRLIIGDLIDSSIMQLLPVSFAQDMVHTLLGGGSSEPAPEVKQAPAQVQKNEQHIRQESIQAHENRMEQPSNHGYNPPQQHVEQHYDANSRMQKGNHVPDNLVYGNNLNRNVNVKSAQFQDLSSLHLGTAEQKNLNLLMDIPLRVTVELGRTEKLIKDILEFSQGSIIELDKLAGEPVDILVNNKLIAKGEVVVIDENFGVRVTDIISLEDRIQNYKSF